MATTDIDQKTLGRICKEVAASNPHLSSALYQVLGLSIVLSQKLYRAHRLREAEPSRDPKCVALYHDVIWLSREGLYIIEMHVLEDCQDGEQGPGCSVMAAKLRASFYHIFCLFHNHPSLAQIDTPGHSPPRRVLTPRADNGQTLLHGSQGSMASRSRKAALRDTIPSMTSESSYITNPYAIGSPEQDPPPSFPVSPWPIGSLSFLRPPTRPPDRISPASTRHPSPASAAYIVPPSNFVPAAISHFATAQTLAAALLPTSNALRLSLALEHCTFLWHCARDFDAARREASAAISASASLDDAEDGDAAELVLALRQVPERADPVPVMVPAIQREGSVLDAAVITPGRTAASPSQQASPPATDAVASVSTGLKPGVASSDAPRQSNRSRQRDPAPAPASDRAAEKARKRRLVERAEEEARTRILARSGTTASQGSGLTTPLRGVGTGRPGEGVQEGRES